MSINSNPYAVLAAPERELLFVATGNDVNVYNSTAQARVGSFEARELVNNLDITLNEDYLVTGSDDMCVYFLKIA